jgi:NAD(P)H-flavin reductase/hemoglobin-like flavoprotein
MVDARRLRSSFAAVARYGDEVPLFFYSHLFLSHPETRDMFPVAMAGQRDKLVAALGQVVANVDDLDGLVPFLQQLGRDHRKFGAVAAHYPAVGASLLATLEHFLGGDWTPELAAEWGAAYELVAQVMVEAADDAAGTSPAWWEAEVMQHERRSLDVAVIHVRTDKPLDYRPGQSVAVESHLRPRVWRYYSPANAPRDDGVIELHVRIVAGGQVSAALVQMLQPGDVLRLGSPVGKRLTLSDRTRGDLVLIAGGTGLAPLRALVDQLVQEQDDGVGVVATQRRVSLYLGGRVADDLYDLANLQRLADEQPWLSVVPVVSGDLSYPGERGLVADVALRHAPWTDPQIYVCGSPAMVAGSVERLVGAGVPESVLHVEDFGGYSLSTTVSTEEGGRT